MKMAVIDEMMRTAEISIQRLLQVPMLMMILTQGRRSCWVWGIVIIFPSTREHQPQGFAETSSTSVIGSYIKCLSATDLKTITAGPYLV